MTEITNVKTYLEAIVKLRTNGGMDTLPDKFKYQCSEDMILSEGESFDPSKQPTEAEQKLLNEILNLAPYTMMKECFNNCTKIALVYRQQGLRYCEGYAMGVIPVHHAWIVTSSGAVFDPTWEVRTERGTEYFGICVPNKVLIRWLGSGNAVGILSWDNIRYHLEYGVK